MNEKVEQKLREMIRTTIKDKLKEDYKNSEWEVYLRDEKGNEKIVKKAKSKRAATILYNRIIKSDDYYEVGMRAIKEGKLNEVKMVTLPNGVKVKIEFKGITLQSQGKKPVFLDRREMMTFFKATQKYMKQGLAAGKIKEEKLTENKIYSKKDGLNIVKKVKAKDKKIYKVDKQKATYGGKKVTMYNLYTKDKQKYSGNNLHGLDMARNSKGEAMYLVPIKEGKLTEDVIKDMMKQIGNNTLRYIGAKKFAKGKQRGMQYLQFDVKGSKLKRGGRIQVYYNRGKDLYNVEGYQIRNLKAKKVAVKKDIYADRLADTIEDIVG